MAHGRSIHASEAVQRSHPLGNLLARLLDLYGCESSQVQSYLDALTVDDLEDGCAFAPTEISLSFSQGRPPSVRCLGEVVNNCAPASPEATVSKLGDHILEALARHGGKYDHELLRDLIRIAYTKHHDVPRTLRFGAVIEWPAHPAAGLKCYFDLHSDGRQLAADRLAASFSRLALGPQFCRAKELLAHRLEEGRCRGMATDLAASLNRGLRLYTPGARWSLRELRELLAATGRSDQIELLDVFNILVLGRLRSSETADNLLVSLVFASAAGNEPILKLDAFMPALKPDDQASYQTFCSLAENLKIPIEDYVKAFEALNGADDPACWQRVVQYFSVDFLPVPKAKLNIYFRLPGAETTHMEVHVRPRHKPQRLFLLDGACRHAIEALERERATQYSEARHRMVFPRAAGFSSEQELHVGEVFQRALIADALLDAERAGFRVDRTGLENDIATLVELRLPDGVRGWKYFPSLPELPADADDVAQVMQVLLRVEYTKLNELFDPLLAAMEKSSYHPDGSFETWIVNSHDRSPESELTTKFIHSYWGTGPDPEVMANMLYALWVYDRKRYRGRIDGAIQYLASCQLPTGSWPAGWYAGSYYSTFACARAFHAADPCHYALYRATRFLLETQHEGGGWGSGTANSGDTAYALRTACLGGNEIVRPTIRQGCQFLVQHQEVDGAWPASDFIAMDTTRAREEVRGPVIVYRSKTITTAACLSALCAARPFANSE